MHPLGTWTYWNGWEGLWPPPLDVIGRGVPYDVSIFGQCHGGARGFELCPYPAKYGIAVNAFPPGIWGWTCGRHAGSYRSRERFTLYPARSRV